MYRRVRLRLTAWYAATLLLVLVALGGGTYFGLVWALDREVDAGIRTRVDEWLATAPDLGAAPRLALPSPSETKLPNGLTVKLVEMHEVPVVQAVLSIEGGARLDGELAGLATFVGGMLDEGAGDRDAFELAAQVEYLGASLSTGAGWDATTISLRAPKRTIAEAMALMGGFQWKGSS